MKPDLWMVFDVESVGLHGEGFAVGWVVMDSTGRVLAAHYVACDPLNASGTPTARQWVVDNIPLLRYDRKSPRGVRDTFWEAWQHWRQQGTVLAADVPWPVEARFLLQCVDDDHEAREWVGPYPLVDLASIRLAAGYDPLGEVPRLPDELPVHHPMADARQSARLLHEALTTLLHP